MTDLPPACPRASRRRRCCRALLTEVRHARDRRGHHPQVAVAAARRHAGRERPDAVPRSGHGLRVEPGRLRHGVPVLRDRPGRAHPQPVDGRDRRAGRGRGPRRGERRAGRRAGAAVERRVHGHGGAAGELPPAGRRAAPARSTGHRPGSACRERSITVSTVGLVPAIGKLADEGLRSRSPSRCTLPTTSCATPSCR